MPPGIMPAEPLTVLNGAADRFTVLRVEKAADIDEELHEALKIAEPQEHQHGHHRAQAIDVPRQPLPGALAAGRADIVQTTDGDVTVGAVSGFSW